MSAGARRVREDTSFSRIFQTAAQQLQQEESDELGRGPSVHELFLAHQQDKISAKQFGDLLGELHGLRFSDQAGKLLQDPNLTFLKFQKDGVRPCSGPGDPFVSSREMALGAEPWAARRVGRGGPFPDPLPAPGAGVAMRFQDTAKAIIETNSGPCVPPENQGVRRSTSDVNQDEGLKVRARLSKMSGGNPVLKSNHPSAGNTLLDGDWRSAGNKSANTESVYAPLEMANTAIRLFLAGEIQEHAFKQVLLGMDIDPDAPEHHEVGDLIRRQAQVGDRSFSHFSKAIGRRIATPTPEVGSDRGSESRRPGAVLTAAANMPAAGVRVIPLPA